MTICLSVGVVPGASDHELGVRDLSEPPCGEIIGLMDRSSGSGTGYGDNIGGRNGDGDKYYRHHDVNVGLPMIACYCCAPVQCVILHMPKL